MAAGVVLLMDCGGAPLTREALESSATKQELSEFAERSPERCVYSAPELELCTWKVEKGARGWSLLARPLLAGGDLNLVCELPIDGSPRADDSCEAHARPAQEMATRGDLPSVSAGTRVAPDPRKAQQRLVAARTLRELSNLVGDVPDRCRTGAGVQICEWSVSEGQPAHALIAAAVSVPEGAIALRCVLPLDGGVREAESCSAAPVE